MTAHSDRMTMREGLASLYEGATGSPAPGTTDESILKLRGLIKANLSATYRNLQKGVIGKCLTKYSPEEATGSTL